MREIATKGVGSENASRRALGGLSSGIAAFLVLMQWACGGADGGGGITYPSPPAAATSLTGTWRGGNDSVRLVWWLTQRGDSVNGASQVTGSGGWTGDGGRVVGTIIGSTLTFNETHAVGTLTVAGCSAEFEGTLQITSFTVPVVNPPRGYPPGSQPVVTRPPTTRSSMSGFVSGRACGGPFSGVVTIVKD